MKEGGGVRYMYLWKQTLRGIFPTVLKLLLRPNSETLKVHKEPTASDWN